jgi:hypothetical protein
VDVRSGDLEWVMERVRDITREVFSNSREGLIQKM